ncbi:C-Myc-binding protein isoform X2 [Tiliqua scincoides]|uniref:C-Myc-binding protein isoform X2 n=1 Tax=Tiliqua scincoides TaxID=71010 RepID=UPI003462976F
MANYKAADSKREQFRRYLEKSGVMDTLTKVLVALYEEPEKPNCALEYPFLGYSESSPQVAFQRPHYQPLIITRVEFADNKKRVLNRR